MKKTSSKRIIIICAGLISVYLATIITMTGLGQNKLKDSQHRELGLQVKSYAGMLDSVLTIAKEDMIHLSTDKTLQTFFANLASGMSMEYGLGASLINLKQKLKAKAQVKLQNEQLLYQRLSLIGLDGKVIATTGKKEISLSEVAEQLSKQRLNVSKRLQIIEESGRKYIRLTQNVLFSGKRVGYLIADLDKNTVTSSLNKSNQEGHNSRLVLRLGDEEIIFWDLNNRDNTGGNRQILHKIDGDLQESIYFSVPDEKNQYNLMAWFEPFDKSDLYTSKLFITILSIIAILMVAGLLYAFYLNNNRVELKIKLEEEKHRKDFLSQQNQRLTQEIERRKFSETELAFLAKHDALTGLPNRLHGSERLSLDLSRASHFGSKVLVMFIDLDHFKQINDSMGHFVGDEVLKLAVDRLQEALRDTDFLARIGGDEFLLIVPELQNLNNAKHFAAKILAVFQQPFIWHNHEFFLSASIGMSVFPEDGEKVEQLLACADMAMYRVKQEGRNAFCFYNQNMNQDLQRFLDLEKRLRHAILYEQLSLYYQPIINLHSGRIVGAEALMRWNDVKLGSVSPDEFISVAEKNGLIHQLGDFAIRHACHQAARWQSIAPISISVNFSSVQFRYCERLLERIKHHLSESGLPAEKFDIEVTEGLLFSDTKELKGLLDDLKALGAKLVIDDFGTGYSALSYLQKFPFDRLKIDRSFMQNMFENDSDRALVKVIIAMAQALKLEIVAEGIEEKRHLEYLQNLNCELGQGFYFSQPLPAEEFELLLKHSNEECLY
ncbi:GGDEF-domain containing protein [Vibrio sagamiensis NBRC 104589]|uniref:GGDEF-domain containing protein n=1 Tax=Vibrio sagamiensis NBRC 104589 TaxID=1219064 RepID=A0A511QDV6_9VIBR|nr:GGDEF-domain containing protein [Vibrio sagamiensis NBRC 104589]